MPRYSKDEVLQWLEELAEGTLDLEANNMQLASDAIEYFYPQPVAPLPPGYLTPHFTLAELCVTSTGLPNEPTPDEKTNLLLVANTLEVIRSLLGNNPIIVTSAFRSEAVNRAVGGVPNSAHRLGLAADFVCPAFGTPKEIALLLDPHIKGLALDQLIYEDKGGSQWVHIGMSNTAPRHMALTITDSGTVNGIA